jgi:hypothetical protein
MHATAKYSATSVPRMQRSRCSLRVNVRRTHIEQMLSALPPIGDIARHRRYAQRVTETAVAVALLCGGIFGRQAGQILARRRRCKGATLECLRRHFGILPGLAVFTGLAFCSLFVLSLDVHSSGPADDVHSSGPPDRGRSHGRMRTGRMRRLRVRGLASRASGGLGRHRPAQLRGSVRQRTGGADESGGNPVESRAVVNGAPVRSRRRSRGLRKTPRRSADRRAGPRYGPAVPFR